MPRLTPDLDDPTTWWTLSHCAGPILDLAESARPEAVVEFVVDDTGVPRSLSLDPIPNGIDEECYEVADFGPVA